MNKLEIRDKLKNILREKLLSSIEANETIPESICNHILESNGWSSVELPENQDESCDFIDSLKQYIDETYLFVNRSETPTPVDYDLSELYNNYIACEKEYCQVSVELIEALEEAIKEKEKYSVLFKQECSSQNASMEVLAVKAKFLELQLFLKLFGEKNALVGHLALQSRLKKELEHMKKKYKEVVELNEEYEKIKSDKTFCELFKKFKELNKIKERSELVKQL